MYESVPEVIGIGHQSGLQPFKVRLVSGIIRRGRSRRRSGDVLPIPRAGWIGSLSPA